MTHHSSLIPYKLTSPRQHQYTYILVQLTARKQSRSGKLPPQEAEERLSVSVEGIQPACDVVEI